MNDEIVKQFLDNPVEGRLALSASLKNFIAFFHWYMYHQNFEFRYFHNLIVKKLEDIVFERNEKKNLVINISPRFGKSTIMKYFCAWSYMLNPQSNCIYTSYSDDLVNSFSKDIRDIVTSKAFVEFTGIAINKSKSGADYWATTKGGGFRAAPLGGSIIGFGFGWSGEGYGGCCFPYNEMVWTDKGKKRIGELVRRKSKLKVWSFNGREFELKPITNWIKIPNAEIMRIEMSDGNHIDCTPDHKFYTKRGYIEAKDLTKDDILFSLSNRLYLGKSNSYSLHDLFSWNGRIEYCGHLLGRKFSSLFGFVINSICPSLKRFSCFDRKNSSLANTVTFSNSSDRTCISSDSDNIIFSEFRPRKDESTQSDSVLHIFRLSTIAKVFKSVILRIRIKVPYFHSFFLFTDKCVQNALMGIQSIVSTVKISRCTKIASAIITKFKDFFWVGMTATASFIYRCMRISFDSSKIRNTVCGSFRYCSPLFISKISHRKYSYCLTIQDNHNMLMGKSQGYLVSNCLVDDPNRSTSAKSQAELQNTIDYYLNSIKTRANNQAKSPIILIMQRLALEDLTGYVLENESDDWDLIKIPALDEDTGKALWEERISADELLKIKKATPFVYYGMYQQEPIVIGGSVIKTEWFRYYDPKDVYDYQFTFITSDTAQKKGEANDFSVFSFWGKTFDNKLHLLDMVRGKWEADELRQQVKLCWKKWSSFKIAPYGFYVEDKSSGIGVIQEIKKTDPIPIIPVTRARYKNDQGQWVAADKFSRVMTAAPYLANGWVYLPNGEKDDISAPLLAECAAFRADLSHKHDDMCFVDMTIIATSKGKKKISDVCIGDKILTPFGYSKVLATSKREAEVITNISLTGTPDHKVFNKYDYNFDKLKNMTYSQVSKLTFKDMLEWKKQIVFNLMARNIIVAKRKDISQLATITKTRKVEQGFIEMFGSFIRERKYRKAIIFTIKMGIGLITIFQTLSAYHAKSILKDIGKRLWIFGKDLKCEKQTQEVERNVRSGTQVKQDISGTQSIRKNISNRSCKNKYANRVVKSSEHLQTQDIKQCAINAEIENCTSSLDNRKKIVYNIQTEAGCYYANGILVSNCDTLCDAVDIAFGSTGISSIFI